jgi:hypothetical protein
MRGKIFGLGANKIFEGAQIAYNIRFQVQIEKFKGVHLHTLALHY